MACNAHNVLLLQLSIPTNGTHGHRTTRATEQRAEGKRAQEARQAQRSAHRRSQNNRAPTDLGQWSCACKAIHSQCDTWRLRPKTSGPVRKPCPLQHTGAGRDLGATAVLQHKSRLQCQAGSVWGCPCTHKDDNTLLG